MASELATALALLDEAREAAVGEHLAAGLTRRAVHDLVRLVRDALQVAPALGARQPVLPVHGEVLAELVRREPAGARRARARAPRPTPPAARRASARARRASATSATRTATAWRGAGCRRRSRARRPRPCAGRAGSCGCAGRRSAVRNHSANSSLVASGPSFSSGPTSSGREHPPTGLAFGAELAQQHRAVVGEAPPHDRTLRARLLRRLLEVEPAGLREVEHDAQVVVEVQRHVLRPPATRRRRPRRPALRAAGRTSSGR